ncbi:MAG: hypothetical protein KAQ68_05150 [Clostridiales bacterium]|nr:hypothetical protein [Clostridiales bacterium]
MPHSTIHLWVAKKVSENFKQESSASFLLGSIVPDATNIRSGVTKEDKQLSHLRQPDFNSGYANAKKILEDEKCTDFLKGCAVHIMLDTLWLKGPYMSMVNQLKNTVSKEEINAMYQKDSEYVELWLFRQNTSRLLWNAVMNAKLERFFDILTPGEIDDYRKSRHIELMETKISHTSNFLTLDIVRNYMDQFAKTISEEIKKIR